MELVRQFHAMGCPCEIRLEGSGDLAYIADLCVTEAMRLERKYTRYRTDSVTGAINRNAGRAATPIDPETYGLLKYADACYQQSDGQFDITSGVLRRAWHQDITSLPLQRHLNALTDLIGWSNVEFDEASISLPIVGMEVDFGGVVKEYASDSLASLARHNDVLHGLISLGGDITIVGPHASGEPWQIGITHPVERHTAIAAIQLASGAITTSGNYERQLVIDGRTFSHIMNPKTGWPVDGLVSVSVVADQAIVAGSLATIALLKPTRDAVKWLQAIGQPYLAIDRELNTYGELGVRNKQGSM